MVKLFLKTNKSAAFTIWEAVITLVIVCSLAILGSVYLHELRSRIVFEQSVAIFKKNLEQAGKYAVINRADLRLDYYPEDHELTIMGEDYYRKVKFDDQLKISALTKYHISDNGMFTPKTIAFSDGKHTKKIRIQMAWGKVIDEE